MPFSPPSPLTGLFLLGHLAQQRDPSLVGSTFLTELGASGAALPFLDDPYLRERVVPLAKRLGVAISSNELLLWARIGIHLAFDQPEFSPEASRAPAKKKRGRPKGSLLRADLIHNQDREGVIAAAELARRSGKTFEEALRKDYVPSLIKQGKIEKSERSNYLKKALRAYDALVREGRLTAVTNQNEGNHASDS